MLYRSSLIIILVMTLLGVTTTIAQVDSVRNRMQANIQKAEQEKASRTNDENKLQGLLFRFLRLAEEADTSIAKREQFTRQTTLYHNKKMIEMDSDGRIHVVVDLRSLDDTGTVKQTIESWGGVIEKVGLVPYIGCRIKPKNLRFLIPLHSVRRIVIPAKGVGSSIFSFPRSYHLSKKETHRIEGKRLCYQY